jgi:Ca2+-binding RTX toxin-like protein
MNQNRILAVVGGLASSVLLGGFLPAAVAQGQPTDVAAAETAYCAGADATILVTKHSPKVLHGTTHRDVIVIRHSGQMVKSHDGNDPIRGSGGRDWLYAGGGGDHVHAKGGADTLKGGRGRDHLYGGHGRDDIDGGPGGHHGGHTHSLVMVQP